MSSQPEIHTAAAQGFEKEAARYQRGRPDYPAALDSWLAGALGIGAGVRVIDLGAGTGRFTAQLSRLGAEVIAVEPVEAMRAQLQAALPGVTALAGSAEAIPLPDESMDAVVCAQSFHWFSTPAALREIHRVLKPGGRLGLVWNVRDDRTAWVRKLAGIVEPHEAGAPRYASGEWRKLFPADGYAPLEEAVFSHDHTGPAEQVIVDRCLSISFIAALPEPEKEAVAAQIRALIARTPELSGDGDVTYPYLTRAFSCVKS